MLPVMIKDHDIPAIRKHVIKKIENAGGFSVEYFEIADDTDLKPLLRKADLEKGKRYYGCIAVKAGNIRLIDNVEVPVM